MQIVKEVFTGLEDWTKWEPCGTECGEGKPECPKYEKCQTEKEHGGSPLLCFGRCEKIPSY